MAGVLVRTPGTLGPVSPAASRSSIEANTQLHAGLSPAPLLLGPWLVAGAGSRNSSVSCAWHGVGVGEGNNKPHDSVSRHSCATSVCQALYMYELM